jgi:hypothetical protein
MLRFQPFQGNIFLFTRAQIKVRRLDGNRFFQKCYLLESLTNFLPYILKAKAVFIKFIPNIDNSEKDSSKVVSVPIYCLIPNLTDSGPLFFSLLISDLWVVLSHSFASILLKLNGKRLSDVEKKI